MIFIVILVYSKYYVQIAHTLLAILDGIILSPATVLVTKIDADKRENIFFRTLERNCLFGLILLIESLET